MNTAAAAEQAEESTVEKAERLRVIGERLIGEYGTHAAALVGILTKLSVINQYIANANQYSGGNVMFPDAVRLGGRNIIPHPPLLSDAVCLPCAEWGGPAWLGGSHKATNVHGSYLSPESVAREYSHNAMVEELLQGGPAN